MNHNQTYPCYMRFWTSFKVAARRFNQPFTMVTALTLGCFTLASAQTGSEETMPPPAAFMELLQAEKLDTVTLDQVLHFTTPEATDIIAEPGTYRIVASAPSRLKLIALKGNKEVEVVALRTNHSERIPEPIALYVRDDEKVPYVVLLIPDGNALEATGSYDAIRPRGLASSQLTPLQIQNALKKKLEMTGH